MNVPLVPIPVTSILFARIPWVHTNARVMLGTQKENLATVFEIWSILHVRPPLLIDPLVYTYRNCEIATIIFFFFKETTYFNLKVLKQDNKLLKVQCLCAKAQHCHVILEKSLKPYFLKHKNNKQTRTTKMDTFTLANRFKPSGNFNISHSNAFRNLQFSCRYRRVFYQVSQL